MILGSLTTTNHIDLPRTSRQVSRRRKCTRLLFDALPKPQRVTRRVGRQILWNRRSPGSAVRGRRPVARPRDDGPGLFQACSVVWTSRGAFAAPIVVDALRGSTGFNEADAWPQ